MRTLFTVGALFAIALSPLALPASASHSATCIGTVTTIEVPGAATVYIDDRDLLNGNGLWIYVEDNGVAGLQQGGTSPLGDRDNCQHANPDMLIF